MGDLTNEVQIAHLNTQLDYLRKEVRALGAKLSDIDSIVLDDAIHREQLAVVVLERVDKLTQEMVMARKREEHFPERHVQAQIHRDARILRDIERRKRYERLKDMRDTYTRKTVKAPCSCGKHKSINFYQGREKIKEGVCPIEWWKDLSMIANYEGRLSEFLKETPFETIKDFELEN